MPGFPAAGIGTHYGDTSLAEDVSQIIYQITPEDTPFYNSTGDSRARSVVHEWQTRSLTTRQHNANPEGFTYSFTGANRRTSRLTNPTQIVAKEIRVSESLQAADQHAISDMFADQMQIGFTEAKTDSEHMFLRGSSASGTATDEDRQADGFCNFMIENGGATNTFTNVSGGVTLTETLFNNLIELGWTAGGKPADVLVNGTMKRKLSTFITGNTKFISADEQRQVNTISTYESDFFPVMIALSRDVKQRESGVTGHDLVMYDRSMISKAWLRPWTSRRTPEIADSMDGVVKMEATLEVGNAGAHVYAANYLSGTND